MSIFIVLHQFLHFVPDWMLQNVVETIKIFPDLNVCEGLLLEIVIAQREGHVLKTRVSLMCSMALNTVILRLHLPSIDLIDINRTESR